MRWLPNAVTGACVAATVARAAASWSELPPVMASHFDAAGNPNGFLPRSAFFTIMALACGAAVVIPALAPLLLRHIPASAINIPHRDYWLAPERRTDSVARLTHWLAWFPVPLATLFALTTELVIDANVRHTALNSGVLWTGLALFLASLAFLIGQLYRQFGSPPPPVVR
jgi:hypothetical protein